MKRFFPLLLCLTLFSISFSTIDVAKTTAPEICEDAAPDIRTEDAALSLAKICSYYAVPSTSQYTCPSNSIGLTIGSDCNGTASAFLTVTNLASNPNMIDDYPLPYGTDEIFFEYTAFGVTKVVGPIDAYKYKYDKLDHYGQNFHMFESEIVMEFDLSTVCPANMANFLIDVRIIHQSGILYDLPSHVGIDDIWYCGLFRESCNYCSPNKPNLCPPMVPGQELIIDDVMVCGGSCYSCNGGGKGSTVPNKMVIIENIESTELENTDHEKQLEVENESNQDEISLKTMPNPFSNELFVAVLE